MQTVIKKWGNSASVRIPAVVLEAARLQVDVAVDVREEDGRIIIEAVSPEKYNLDALIAGITSTNLHEETDFGHAVGNEAF
ncbi:MAG TPA: AbrB/MazE/SpoVT family DNA-binding domain-containing protein [Eoetvoesiella sp.]|jgi:antitoxin MazE|uniref:AbrB/MazE/SpoVT family DNA-binding domain-containing protein n=1 Tax=Eoetvoesiella sp. TaxID=1966355 RepID=UPI002BBE83AC|nr:AbrB/MazE/SpoVT family DNA-binding domain-containing protein [Eoetvoesiella sp.]HWK62597.1 AbrB/MazE/SpoVT family DNA-binding domain-containing protein [Eoetvoesiella sp.]